MLTRTRPRNRVCATPARAGLDSATTRWTRQADLAGVALTVRLSPELTGDLACPELVDVLEPIVDNAVRHTPTTGRVSVEARSQADPTRIIVDVTNSGTGVPAELAGQIFDAWVSGRDASVAGGLGLWLARETARDVGGDVTLVDRESEVTTFRVVLPATLTRPS